MSNNGDIRDQIRLAAESDLRVFIALIAPHRVLGAIHEDMIRWWTREDAGDHQLVLMPRDHQKALRLSEKVLTPSGWEVLGNIKVNDLLIGKDGKPTKVTYLHPISTMDIYRVTFSDGRKSYCNGEHLWTVTCPSNTGSKQVTKPLKDIIKNYKSDRFDKRNNKTYTECRYFLDPVSPVEFSEKELLIEPYTLGVWLGDGSSASGGFTTADQEILDNIPYEISTHKAKYHYGILGIMDSLRKLNVLSNKHIPEEYLRSSISQRESLLQGLIDTDGHVHKTNKNLSYTTTSSKLRDGVVELVRGLGGRATVSDSFNTSSKEGPIYHHSYCINIWLPDSIVPCRLKRKLARVQKGQNLKVAIKDITKVAPDKARCITVANEDGLFVTNDYLVTHNSAMVAYRVAWWLTKYPWETFLYVSATTTLAEKQLYFIKNIFTSPIYRQYWPEMVNKEEGKREKWTSTEIMLDHPIRKEEGIRDASIQAAGLTTTITGLHFTKAVLDDVVVKENAHTEEGREKVRALYSLLASVETTGSEEWVVGTRYDPRDLYNDLISMEEDTYDRDGELIGSTQVYETFQKEVEDRGDGTGEFLWPRQQRKDGKFFGFNIQILAKKRAKYLDQMQYRAQYYNDPNDPDNEAIPTSRFQYYDKKFLEQVEGHWEYNGARLNVYAAIDFAFSLARRADYTAICVIGISAENQIYILDIDRFKTEKISEYFKHILDLHVKWGFTKLRAEVNVAQNTIVESLKKDYIIANGLQLSVDSFRPTRNEGNKEERMGAILEPRYANMQVWHFKGGHCFALEEELVKSRPAHDDIKDSLSSAIDLAVPPVRRRMGGGKQSNVVYHPRFGGVTQ